LATYKLEAMADIKKGLLREGGEGEGERERERGKERESMTEKRVGPFCCKIILDFIFISAL
jgi:hypothetical protein